MVPRGPRALMTAKKFTDQFLLECLKYFFLFNSHIARYRENFLKFSFSFCTKNVIIFCQKIQISVSVPDNVISKNITLHFISWLFYECAVTFNSHIARYRENFQKFSFSFCTKNIIIFCQKIQISVSVPDNVISQTLHCISVHVYCMTVLLSTSSVVVTTAWVVLSISKMLLYFLYLCLIWHGHVVLCCIFTEAWGYVCYSPIILSIPNPDFPKLYPVLWSRSMDQPFTQRVYPFSVGYGCLTFAQGNPYCRWEPIWMLWQVMQ